MTVSELARRVGVSETTLWRWHQAGYLPAEEPFGSGTGRPRVYPPRALAIALMLRRLSDLVGEQRVPNKHRLYRAAVDAPGDGPVLIVVGGWIAWRGSYQEAAAQAQAAGLDNVVILLAV